MTGGSPSDPSALNDEGLLKLIDSLKTMTIRGMNLFKLLRLLAFRNGRSFPLAITGGSVRDAIQGRDVNDIDIVVGGTYDEVQQYLKDLFASHGEALTENTLYTKPAAKRFGQLKIMNIQVCSLCSLSLSMLSVCLSVCLCVCTCCFTSFIV